MSRYAIYLNHYDLTPLAANLSDVNLTNAQKSEARKHWNGGLKDWSVAPIYTGWQASNDPDCRIVVVDTGPSGPGLAALTALLRDLAATNPARWYMARLAADLDFHGTDPYTGP